MVYVSSDWHGFPLKQIKALLAKAAFGPDDFLFVLGDVIDRGTEGIELLKWLMVQYNVELILGNHEAMLLSNDWMFEEVTQDSLDALTAEKIRRLEHWESNGAEPTIDALSKESPETRADILEYLREAPLYDSVSLGERDFLLVHGGLGGYRPDKPIDEYSMHELVWERPTLDTRYSKAFMTVVGHTPTCFYGKEYKGKILKRSTFINVDTGVACGLSPCLLRLDDMKEFYIDE